MKKLSNGYSLYVTSLLVFRKIYCTEIMKFFSCYVLCHVVSGIVMVIKHENGIHDYSYVYSGACLCFSVLLTALVIFETEWSCSDV